MHETPKEQIKRQIEDPDEMFVGPYEKCGDNAFHIESLAWAAGLEINDEGFAVDAGPNARPRVSCEEGRHDDHGH